MKKTKSPVGLSGIGMESINYTKKWGCRYLVCADRYAFSRIDRFGCIADPENKKEVGQVCATRTY